MDTKTWYLLAADLTLLLHTLFVAFVVIGLILILIGKALGWQWITNPWYRWAHLGAIAVVVLQSWFGMICPLTTLEMALRARAGAPTYGGTFIAHWLQAILYYEAPPWVFAVCYTAFGLLVIAAWVWIRPRRFGPSDIHSDRS